jgi:hypothetical protein
MFLSLFLYIASIRSQGQDRSKLQTMSCVNRPFDLAIIPAHGRHLGVCSSDGEKMYSARAMSTRSLAQSANDKMYYESISMMTVRSTAQHTAPEGYTIENVSVIGGYVAIGSMGYRVKCRFTDWRDETIYN